MRFFPALASLGAATRAHGASIVLVQEPAPGQRLPGGRKARARPLEAVASRLLPVDPVRAAVLGLAEPLDAENSRCWQLEEVFESGPAPLASFRSAILCKHSRARAEREANSPKGAAKDGRSDRDGPSTVRVVITAGNSDRADGDSGARPGRSSRRAQSRPRRPSSARSRTMDRRSATRATRAARLEWTRRGLAICGWRTNRSLLQAVHASDWSARVAVQQSGHGQEGAPWKSVPARTSRRSNQGRPQVHAGIHTHEHGGTLSRSRVGLEID